MGFFKGVGEGFGEGEGAAAALKSGRQTARLRTRERNFMGRQDPISRGVTLADGLRVAKNFRMSDHRRVRITNPT